MVERRYAQLSDQDKLHFDQMKTLAEQIKREMGECDLIEEIIARVVHQRYGTMKKEDVGRVLGCEGEGAEGGKVLERAAEGHLRIKQEPGIELDRVVLSVVVPTEDPAVLQYAIVEDQDRSDCITLLASVVGLIMGSSSSSNGFKLTNRGPDSTREVSRGSLGCLALDGSGGISAMAVACAAAAPPAAAGVFLLRSAWVFSNNS